MSKGKIISPSQMGQKGIPKGVGAAKRGKGVVISPSQMGKKGMPGKAGFPGGKAALD